MPPAVLALFLISAELGRERRVLEEIERVEGVREAYVVYGMYDIIVEIEGENQESVRNIVFSKIRNLDNVKSTLTLVVAPN